MDKMIIKILTALTLTTCVIHSSQAVMSHQVSNEAVKTSLDILKAFQYIEKHQELQHKVFDGYNIAMHKGLTKHQIDDVPYLDEINDEVSNENSPSELSRHESSRKIVEKIGATKKLTVKEMLQRLKNLSR